MRLLAGQPAFVVQRLSALVLLAFVAAGALRLAFGAAPSFAGWQAWAASAHGAALLLVLGGALVAHAWVGVRDVVLDYLHAHALRLGALGAAAIGLAGLGAWIFVTVIRHAISHPAL
jgi:succinate dehydrogenase / fumarate reductase membrane anchor subunit